MKTDKVDKNKKANKPYSRRKYWAAFAVGILWGVLITFICGFLYLRYSLIKVTPSRLEFMDTFQHLAANIPKQHPGWTVKPQTCVPPTAPDRSRLKIINLCNRKLAAELLRNPADRKVSAMIPCAMAIYEAQDGQVYVAKLNVGLIGWLLGGNPGRIFPKVVAPDQQRMLNDIKKYEPESKQ